MNDCFLKITMEVERDLSFLCDVQKEVFRDLCSIYSDYSKDILIDTLISPMNFEYGMSKHALLDRCLDALDAHNSSFVDLTEPFKLSSFNTSPIVPVLTKPSASSPSTALAALPPSCSGNQIGVPGPSNHVSQAALPAHHSNTANDFKVSGLTGKAESSFPLVETIPLNAKNEIIDVDDLDDSKELIDTFSESIVCLDDMSDLSASPPEISFVPDENENIAKISEVSAAKIDNFKGSGLAGYKVITPVDFLGQSESSSSANGSCSSLERMLAVPNKTQPCHPTEGGERQINLDQDLSSDDIFDNTTDSDSTTLDPIDGEDLNPFPAGVSKMSVVNKSLNKSPLENTLEANVLPGMTPSKPTPAASNKPVFIPYKPPIQGSLASLATGDGVVHVSSPGTAEKPNHASGPGIKNPMSSHPKEALACQFHLGSQACTSKVIQPSQFKPAVHHASVLGIGQRSDSPKAATAKTKEVDEGRNINLSMVGSESDATPKLDQRASADDAAKVLPAASVHRPFKLQTGNVPAMAPLMQAVDNLGQMPRNLNRGALPREANKDLPSASSIPVHQSFKLHTGNVRAMAPLMHAVDNPSQMPRNLNREAYFREANKKYLSSASSIPVHHPFKLQTVNAPAMAPLMQAVDNLNQMPRNLNRGALPREDYRYLPSASSLALGAKSSGKEPLRDKVGKNHAHSPQAVDQMKGGGGKQSTKTSSPLSDESFFPESKFGKTLVKVRTNNLDGPGSHPQKKETYAGDPKALLGSSTPTAVKRLTPLERRMEIARMQGYHIGHGDHPTNQHPRSHKRKHSNSHASGQTPSQFKTAPDLTHAGLDRKATPRKTTGQMTPPVLAGPGFVNGLRPQLAATPAPNHPPRNVLPKPCRKEETRALHKLADDINRIAAELGNLTQPPANRGLLPPARYIPVAKPPTTVLGSTVVISSQPPGLPAASGVVRPDQPAPAVALPSAPSGPVIVRGTARGTGLGCTCLEMGIPCNHHRAGPSQGSTAEDLSAMMARVIGLFPDVCPDFVRQKLEVAIGSYPDPVQWLCNQMLEQEYTKKPTPIAAKPKQPSSKPKDTTDYLNSWRELTKHDYDWQAITEIRQVLGSIYRLISMTSIDEVLRAVNHRISPSLCILQKITESQEYAKTEKHRYRGPSSLRLEVVLPGERKSVPDQLKMEKKTFTVRLNKNPRAASFKPKHPQVVREVLYYREYQHGKQLEKDHQLAINMNQEEYEQNQQGIECECCYTEYPFENMVQCFEMHLFCSTCLQSYVKESVYGQGKGKLTCMAGDCSSTFPREQLEKSLSGEMLTKYDERLREEAVQLAGLEDLVRCPYCQFAAALPLEMKAFCCPQCGRETCRDCHQDWTEHFGKKCKELESKSEEQLRTRYEEKMTEALIRTCHRCKAKIIKETGCNKMTCRCGAKMCYICRKPNIDYNHFCQHVRDPKVKGCIKCNACCLWEVAENLDDKNISAIKEDLHQEQEEKGIDTSKRAVGVPDALGPGPSKKPRKQ